MLLKYALANILNYAKSSMEKKARPNGGVFLCVPGMGDS